MTASSLASSAAQGGLPSSSEGFLGLLLSFLLGCFAAYFMSYMKKKGEQKAKHEEFATLLREQLTSTWYNDSLKGVIQKANQEELESFRMKLLYEGEVARHLREQVQKYKDDIDEQLVVLDVLAAGSRHVPWLAATPNRVVQETGATALARIRLALAKLRELGVADDSDIACLEALDWEHPLLVGAVAEYQEAVNTGGIKQSGDASESARRVESALLERHKEWHNCLRTLRGHVVALAAKPVPRERIEFHIRHEKA